MYLVEPETCSYVMGVCPLSLTIRGKKLFCFCSILGGIISLLQSIWLYRWIRHTWSWKINQTFSKSWPITLFSLSLCLSVWIPSIAACENVHQLFIVIAIVCFSLSLSVWTMWVWKTTDRISRLKTIRIKKKKENNMESLKNFVRYSGQSSANVRTNVINDLIETLKNNQTDGKWWTIASIIRMFSLSRSSRSGFENLGSYHRSIDSVVYNNESSSFTHSIVGGND